MNAHFDWQRWLFVPFGVSWSGHLTGGRQWTFVVYVWPFALHVWRVG